MAVNGVGIKVGQTWRTRGGDLADVVGNADNPKFPLKIRSGRSIYSVTNDGRQLPSANPSPYDLVELIGEVPNETQQERFAAADETAGYIDPWKGLAKRMVAEHAAGFINAAAEAVAHGHIDCGSNPPFHISVGLDTSLSKVAGPNRSAVPSGGGKLERKSNYYQVQIERPVDSQSDPYLAECADIIEALNMTFNEGEAFKALWRLAAARQGRTKAGGDPIYDADKVAHYGARTAAQTRAQQAVAK